MSIGKLLVAGIVIGGLVLVASAMSQPARPKVQIRKDGGGFYWALVEADGTTVSQTSMRFPDEDSARAAAQEAMAVE